MIRKVTNKYFNIEMQTSEENPCHSVCTQNGSFIKSPISKLFDQGIDTPQKLPAAPHSSPINMDTETSNPKSKEMFRTELLRACLLKIPEAVTDELVFNDYLSTKSPSACEDPISDMPECPQGQYLLRLHKKAKLEGEWASEDEILTDPVKISHVKDSPSNFNPRQSCKLCEKVCLEENLEETTSARVNDFEGKSENSKIVNSFHLRNNGRVSPPHIIVNSINKRDGAEQLHDHSIDRVAFYDHTTDHQEIFRLLNVNSEWKEHSDSIFGRRSPGSDNISTVAVCASDASDISDDLSTRSMDLRDMDRSMDLRDMDKSTDLLSNPNKKKSRSAVRRFLNWRRSLKFRKRAASLDESRFPFLANRFDSYKTEFELSV